MSATKNRKPAARKPAAKSPSAGTAAVKAGKVNELFADDGSIHVVVDHEPMSHEQLRLLFAGGATLEQIAAENACRRFGPRTPAGLRDHS